jgi:hypothetical protein
MMMIELMISSDDALRLRTYTARFLLTLIEHSFTATGLGGTRLALEHGGCDCVNDAPSTTAATPKMQGCESREVQDIDSAHA